MTHYSSNRQQQLDEYNKIIRERKQNQTLEEALGKPHTKLNSVLCPTGSYLDLDTDECYPLPTESLVKAGVIYKEEVKTLKDVKGKAEGARYCFLSDIGNLMSSGKTKELGALLSLIVRRVESGEIEEAKHHCYEAMSSLSDEHTMNDLIGVRAQALSSGKYSFESYREEIDVNLLLDAAARHYLKILFVSNTDEESGYPHTAHIAANIIMIHTQLEIYHA